MSLQLSTNPARTSKAPPSSQQNRRPTQAIRRHLQISRLRRGSLDCFSEKAPYFDEQLRMMENPETKCNDKPECSLAPVLRKEKDKLNQLIEAIKGQTRPEDTRRRASLHILKNTPKRKFTDKDCRDLGDAYFSLRCPKGSKILTSNVKDHSQLSNAVGLEVEKFLPKAYD